MALIAICCHDTEDNGRTKFTIQTIESLLDTVDLERHKIIIHDNNSCAETKHFLSAMSIENGIHVIQESSNIGTAKGINACWKNRKPNQHLIKMDNDCVVNYTGWVDELEEAIEADPAIGIIGLKRKDLLENPFRPLGDMFRSELRMLPHELGQRWIIVEDVNHVMGTCQMYNHRLISKIGGMYQMEGLYGFDDTLASVRAHLAGFKTCFLPHIEIDHIDPGGTDYSKWKQDYAGEMMDKFNETKNRMASGEMPIYFEI